MRGFGRFFILMLFAVGFISPPASALESKSGKITLRGYVAPAKYVFVDDGVITRIISNSNVEVEPTLALNPLATEIAPMTPELTQQYEKIKAAYNLNRYGEVYNLAWHNTAPTAQLQVAANTLALQSTSISIDPSPNLLSIR